MAAPSSGAQPADSHTQPANRPSAAGATHGHGERGSGETIAATTSRTQAASPAHSRASSK
jgi:hypothetical protein